MSAVLTPAATTPPPAAPTGPRPWRWTREAYCRLDELGFFLGKRVELIRGEIIEMPRPSWPHVLGKTKTAEFLRAAFAGIGWVSDQSPLPTSDSDPQPDLAVFPGSPQDYTDHPTDALLVVEVAESSLNYDLTTKVELYASISVPEYWVLDLVNRRLVVHRDPVQLPIGGATYKTQLVLAPADSVAPLAVPTASVRVADLLP